MTDFERDISPLLPDRRRQGDFFVCDIFDAAPKGDMASMEHPIFSISTKPDRRIRRYENGDVFVEVTPSVKGLATVHDRDILIFCISQIMAALNNGQAVSQILRFKAFDLLSATNRGTDGRGYEQLRAAFERLSGTRITTNVTTGDVEVFDGFGLIDSFRIVRESREGRMQEVEIRISDWVFNAIRHREVLTINSDYFRLRKPLERRIYELARKHCGAQAKWKIGLKKLKEKCGSSSTDKEFKRLLQNIQEQDEKFAHIPDYTFFIQGDMVIVLNRSLLQDEEGLDIHLSKEAYHDAAQVAPGMDVEALEEEWKAWLIDFDMGVPQDPMKAFVTYCRKAYEKQRQQPRIRLL